MPTCLFTGTPLGPCTRIEHTIQRVLGGRFRSREVSSDTFNAACSEPFDAELASPYQPLFNRLKPLLAAEHGTARLEVTIPGDPNRYRLEPGGELTVQGRRIDERDAIGRPIALAAEDRADAVAMAAGLGLAPGDYTLTEDTATRARLATRHVAALTPNMELAVLKGALLTFDHVLRDDPRRFTRRERLAGLREEIRRCVMERAPTADMLERVVHSIAYEDLDEINRLRAAHGPAQHEFGHVLIASADPTAGTLDRVSGDARA